MIRHILLVKTRDGVSEKALNRAKQAFMEAPNTIDGILNVEWGENNSPEEKHQGFNLCIQMTFTDIAARDHYLPHPEHEVLKQDFVPIIDDILVFDYTATELFP